jgi:hypothetical protein
VTERARQVLRSPRAAAQIGHERSDRGTEVPLLSLQRAAGNRAVSRLIDQFREPRTDTKPDDQKKGGRQEPKSDPKRDANGGSLVAGTPATVVVQRRVGFEFEAVGDPKWTFQGGDSGGTSGWSQIKKTKETLLWAPNAKSGISADNGHPEFVTQPLASWNDVEIAISEIKAMARGIQTQPGRTRNFTNTENSVATPHTGKNYHRIVGQSTLMTKPQATVGVSLLGIQGLFAALQAMSTAQDPLRQKVGNPVTTYQLATSDTGAVTWVTNAVNHHQHLRAGQQHPDGVDVILHMNEIHGFLSIVLKTLWDAYSNSSNELSDPKYAFPLMSRTHFKAIAASMQPGSKTALKALWASGALLQTFPYLLDEPIFPEGYKDSRGRMVSQNRRTTKRQWLQSIFADDAQKDLLSPPEGYRGEPEEGLGAMGTDEVDPRLVLIELRHVTSGEPIGPDDWIRLARVVASIDAVREGQSALRPPDQ